MRDFLFPPHRLQSRVRDLSGGERTRLMLARLFARPFNVLVMDEPTNDLDLETLELLERLLIDYAGTLLLVSHDRDLLNNVVSKTLVIEDRGQVSAYAGGYDDWLWQRSAPPEERTETPAPTPEPRPAAPVTRKITYREQQELDALPARIEALEAEQAQLYETLSDPQLYQEKGDEVAALTARLDALRDELEAAYERWEALDALPE
jgi:ATP-binding cassette subfamily F protein uup